jgi:hypothetical protein
VRKFAESGHPDEYIEVRLSKDYRKIGARGIFAAEQGCQIFLGTTYQNWEKYQNG